MAREGYISLHEATLAIGLKNDSGMYYHIRRNGWQTYGFKADKKKYLLVKDFEPFRKLRMDARPVQLTLEEEVQNIELSTNQDPHTA